MHRCVLVLVAVSGSMWACAAVADSRSWSQVSVVATNDARREVVAARGDLGSKRRHSVPPLPVRKGAAPVPDVWPQAVIAAALARCARQLKTIDAVAEHLAPIKQGKCGAPAPIRLISLGRKYRVTFSPPALIDCDMAVKLNEWLDQEVQPLAAKHLGARIAKIQVMSDYSCRVSTGRHNRLSEHAFANALDIGGFVTDKGRTVRVLDAWGETQRDIAVKEAAKKAAVARTPTDKTTTGKGAAAEKTAGVAAKPGAIHVATRLGGPAGELPQDRPAKVASLSPQLPAGTAQPKETPKEPGARFLRAAHAAACQIFGTTLGPEANEAHRNHFHVDLAKRKYKKYQHICD
jgi:hypothetical protein